MTMITPSYLGETIEYSSLHACRSTLEDPTLPTLFCIPYQSQYRLLAHTQRAITAATSRYKGPIRSLAQAGLDCSAQSAECRAHGSTVDHANEAMRLLQPSNRLVSAWRFVV